MRIYANKLKVILAERGMTQVELAAASGLSRQSVNTILARGTCELKTAGKIAKGLGIQVAEIIKED